MKVTSEGEAIALGHRFYYPHAYCKNGHNMRETGKLVGTTRCYICRRDAENKRRNNPETKAKNAEYYKNYYHGKGNEACKESRAKYYDANKEKIASEYVYEKSKWTQMWENIIDA